MHIIPIDVLIACAGILAVLQGLSLLLTNLETAARRVEGRSTWIARDGTPFDEFSLSELETSRVMQQDFEETRGESFVTAAFGIPANG